MNLTTKTLLTPKYGIPTPRPLVSVFDLVLITHAVIGCENQKLSREGAWGGKCKWCRKKSENCLISAIRPLNQKLWKFLEQTQVESENCRNRDLNIWPKGNYHQTEIPGKTFAHTFGFPIVFSGIFDPNPFLGFDNLISHFRTMHYSIFRSAE